MSQIMKKAILTFGLFSMIMVLTSFTTPGEIGGNSTPKTGDSGAGMTTEIGGSTAPKTGDTGAGIAIGGSTTPKTGDTGAGIAIGGSTTPKSGDSGLGIADIGGSSVPRNSTDTRA
jgi:hypothetical protein